MDAAQPLHDLGQSLWLDNITRSLLMPKTERTPPGRQGRFR